MRKFKNVAPTRQKLLSSELSWIYETNEHISVPGICTLSLSYFDHWLTEAEAESELENVPVSEQIVRDKIHHKFIVALTGQTELLHFIFRGRKKNVPIFRNFTSKDFLNAYLLPQTLGGKRRTQFRIAVPAYHAVVYEGFDDTVHVYFSNHEMVKPLLKTAIEAGLHVLTHS